MKTLELKKVEETVVINNQQVKTEISYLDLLKIAVNAPSQGGYTVSEMGQRLRILDVINATEKANDNKIAFEDADFTVLSKLVKDAKWSVISRTIVDFVGEFDK